MKTTSLLLSIGLVTLNFSCQVDHKEPLQAVSTQKQTEEQSVVKPPVEKLAIQAKTFTINATQKDTVQMPNGTCIIIPENAFVDQNGQPIKGEVTLEWKEFHSLTDILLSGIPMKYDSMGVQYDFQSGGMFDIDGNQNGNPIKIADGKSVQVDLMSMKDTPCYNFYELNERTGEWKYETTNTGQSQVVEKDIETKKIIDANVSLDAYPELQKRTIVGWEPVKKLSRKDYNQIGYEDSEVHLTGSKKEGYFLKFIFNKEIKNYEVKPIFIEDYQSKSQKLKKEIEEDYKELLEYTKNVVSGKVLRSISIDKFGTYNYDIAYKRENAQILAAKFEYPKGINVDLVSLYLVSPKEEIIVSFDAKFQPSFSFDPNNPNVLVALSPDGKIYVLDDSAFDPLRASKANAYTFKFGDIQVEAESPEDLGKLMVEICNL